MWLGVAGVKAEASTREGRENGRLGVAGVKVEAATREGCGWEKSWCQGGSLGGERRRGHE
jgi:hypothetical protein